MVTSFFDSAILANAAWHGCGAFDEPFGFTAAPAHCSKGYPEI
jgi:hypothetical protein